MRVPLKKTLGKKNATIESIYTNQLCGAGMARYVDSHVHLSDAEYAGELDYTVSYMERLGIVACAVSMDYADSARTLEISDMGACVLPFVGIHPERVSGPGVEDALHDTVALAEQNADRIAGIGEIGLDPTYAGDGMIPPGQVRVFEHMLELASRLGKPVSIHSRRSLDRVFDVMTSFDAGRASLHWFDGSKRQLARARDMGFYVSFGPVATYANDKQRLIELSDMDRILVETDGPVRFSRCFELRAGHPCFVASVLHTISEVRRMPFDSVADAVAKNSADYLGMS